jgi:hypothetical protein
MVSTRRCHHGLTYLACGIVVLLQRHSCSIPTWFWMKTTSQNNSKQYCNVLRDSNVHVCCFGGTLEDQKSLVSQFELAQSTFRELKKHPKSATAAQISGDSLLQYIITSHFPGNWRVTSYTFILHCKE